MKRALSSIATAIVVVAAYACGGAVEPGNGDASNDGAPIQDASSPICPSSPPSSGASCSPTNATCEYGSDPDFECNTVARCTTQGWQLDTPSSGPGCPTPSNASGCPDSFFDVPTGQHCGDLVNTTCSYPQGFCGCSVGSGGPYPADAAAVATWICDAPEAGCPMPRPKLGSACAQDNLQCDYSVCALPMGESVICQDGAWQEQAYGCAL